MLIIRDLIAIAVVCLTGSPGYAQEHIIKMVSNETGMPVFDPDYLLILPGDVVTWVNTDSDVLHNVVAEPAGVPRGSALFESPLVDASGKWSYRFSQAGTYQYHCHPHFDEGMMGRIVVGRESLPDERRTNSGGHMHHHEGGHN